MRHFLRVPLLLALCLASAAEASAFRVGVGVGFGLYPQPVYYRRPAMVVVEPLPPPVVVYQPAPQVVYQPAPQVVYQPAPAPQEAWQPVPPPGPDLRAPVPAGYMKYTYYPACDVYLDPLSGKYWAIKDRTWTLGPLPGHIHEASLGRSTVVLAEAGRPWTRHPDYRHSR